MDYSDSYNKFFNKLKRNNKQKGNVFSTAVGGDYEEMGYIQMQLLRQAGLSDNDHVVDVGCGTGRLAFQLAEAKHAQYTGFDVVGDFLKFAKTKCRHSGYRLKRISGTSIPLPDQSADFICFSLSSPIYSMKIRSNTSSAPKMF
jgi:ubiquinone/menaquinone biosynthesis C-methylase UbiE